MEGKGQARILGNSRPNRLCAHNHRYSKAAHLSHLAKQQRKPGEDRVLVSTMTSQVKEWSPATRSHDKYRGRRKTTTPPLNGRLHRTRNQLQWKPSFAINSDKRQLQCHHVIYCRRGFWIKTPQLSHICLNFSPLSMEARLPLQVRMYDYTCV